MTANTKREENLREQTMRFRVTSEEWQEIMERAESTGLTLSGYLRAAALNHQVSALLCWAKRYWQIKSGIERESYIRTITSGFFEK